MLKILKNKNNNSTQTELEKSNNSVLNVNIKSRTNTYFNGTATSITSINDTGEFDILPFHANFVTLIHGFVTIDKRMPTEKKLEIKSAVLSALGGKVDIYVEI